MRIVKGDGSREEFDIEKLERSMLRSGAPKEAVHALALKVTATIRDGMTTSEIYRSAFRQLKKEESTFAARYSMRRAILEMGPTGFPFEDYFCALMRAKGYQAKVRQIITGTCTHHEVDVVLEKDGLTIGAELKFHNTPGFKTDLKTALYVRARFWDIEYAIEDQSKKSKVQEGWLVTNTKFTSQAIEYGECAGIKLLGWGHPTDYNLADIVRETGLYPITVLTTLTKKEQRQLLQNQITVCKDIHNNPDLLAKAGIAKRKHREIIEESLRICGS